MQARDVMTEDPTTLSVEDSVSDALTTLRELDVRHVPVLQGSRLIGMLSDRDLTAWTLPPLSSFEHPDEARERLSAKLGEVMSADVVTVGPDDELADVVDILIDNRVGAVPVVDEETDELVGILSYVDILRACQDLL
jgi:CBS domain-containing protein